MKRENYRKFNIFVSILTCFIIMLACLSPSFISCADENPRLVDLYDFSESVIENDDTDFPFLKTDNSNYSTIIDFYNSTYNDTGFSLPSSALRDVESCPHYALICENVEDWKFILLPEDTFLVGNSTGYAIYVPVDNENVSIILYGYFFDHYNTWQQTYLGYHNTQHWGPSANATVDGDKYYKLWFRSDTSAWGPVLSSDVPCYASDSLTITTLDGLDNVNSSISIGGYSEANILSNNYLGSNNNIYMSGSKVNSSILHILLDFNRNQMEQKNIDTDKLTYDIHMDWIVQGTCTADSKSRQMLNYYFGDGTANWWDNLNGKTYSFNTAFQGSWSGLSCSNVNEISSTIYNDGIYTNGKTATTMANYLSSAVNTGNTVSDTKSFFDSFSDMSILGYSINSMTNSNHTSLTTCYYDVTVDVFYDGEKINDSPITGRCDWLNGSQEMLSNVSDADVSQALANNNNGLPITDPNYKDPNGYEGTIQIVDNSTGGSGGSGGNIESGAIVINNNPTFNNNTSSSSSSFGSGGIIGFILGAIIGNNKSSSDTITSMTGANGWLEVISSTWSWIPTQIWSVLITTFTAVIGIIVVAFIISIVIRFIT